MATKVTTGSPNAWAPDEQEFVPADVIPAALLLTTATLVGSIEGDDPSIRVPYVSDDGTSAIVAEGTDIGDANQTFDEVVVTTAKVATYGTYSYEVLAQDQAADNIIQSLSRSIIRKANALYLGSPVADPGPTGLLHITGVIDGGAIATDLDPLIDAVAGIESAGGTATHIIASPDAWASLSKLKRATDSHESLVGAGTVAAERALLGLPVLVTPDAPAASFVVIDKTAVLAAQSPVRVARSDHAAFKSDASLIRVTWRMGWSVMWPDRVAKLTTTVTP